MCACVSTSTEFIQIVYIIVYKFLTESYKLWSFFFVSFFIQQKIYPKHALLFVGIVLAETQQRRDIGMLIT